MHNAASRLCLCRLYEKCIPALEQVVSGDHTQTDSLYELSQQYISTALEVCSSTTLDRIWGDQDPYCSDANASHVVELWVAPAADMSSEDVQEGKAYSSVPSHEMADFVVAVQAAVDSCGVSGITAQVCVLSQVQSALQICSQCVQQHSDSTKTCICLFCCALTITYALTDCSPCKSTATCTHQVSLTFMWGSCTDCCVLQIVPASIHVYLRR